MLVILDRPRLLRLIAIVRDDHGIRKRERGNAPFMRMEASGDSLKLSGRVVEATLPATVLEPGVLFLRVARFRHLLNGLRAEKTLTIQVNGDGLLFGYIRMPLESNDMLLYPDPKTAPARHPLERLAEEEPDPQPESPQLPLFPGLELPPPAAKQPGKRSRR